MRRRRRPNLKRLRTVKQIAKELPAFNEKALRWLVFNGQESGFDRCVYRAGRRLLIDLDAFEIWLADTQLHRPA